MSEKKHFISLDSGPPSTQRLLPGRVGPDIRTRFEGEGKEKVDGVEVCSVHPSFLAYRVAILSV